MKGIVVFTAVLTLTSAQVVFPEPEESNGPDESRSSNNADSQLNTALFNLDRSSFNSQPRNEGSCNLPDGSSGNCVPFSQCSSYSTLATNLNNPDILNFLRARVCRLLTNVVHICCPVRTNTITTNTITNPQVSTGSQNTLFPSDCGQSFRDRIIDGTEVPVGAYPWLVAIGTTSQGVFDVNCGGSLITRRHVITAAHCFARVFKPTHARVGEHDVTTDNDGANPITLFIKRIILSNYNKDTNQNDIAILTLEADVSFNNNIQPICLPFRPDLRNNNFVGNRLDIAGWGRTIHSVRETSPVPLEAKVEVVTEASCKAAYIIHHLEITERQMCAGTGGADTCSGDSGGPLHYIDQGSDRFFLAGVTSFGAECGLAGFPGVYTRVGSYLDWIKSNVN